jgi:O-antigen ligase
MIQSMTTASSGKRTMRKRARRRDIVVIALAAVSVLAGHMLFGASEPKSEFFVSGCLILSAICAVAVAGPRHVHWLMAALGVVVLIYGASGMAGSLDYAMPHLAGLFAAGAACVIGYVAARRRTDIRILLVALVWSSLVFCVWYFFNKVSTGTILDATTAKPESLLFGLLALVGQARVLHVVKTMDAEALSRSEMIERLLRDGLGGLMLAGFAVTCLLLTGYRTGALLTAAVLLFHAWWDMRGILRRDHRSIWLRWLSAATPVIALALAALGGVLAFLVDYSAARPLDTDRLLHVERLSAYFEAWLDNPVLGYGLGSIDSVRDKVMTLWNADALMADGGPQNFLLHQLVETGLIGTLALLVFIGGMHTRILVGVKDIRAPRTMLRLATCSTLLLAVYGLFVSSLDVPSVSWLYAMLLGAACGVAVGDKDGDKKRGAAPGAEPTSA